MIDILIKNLKAFKNSIYVLRNPWIGIPIAYLILLLALAIVADYVSPYPYEAINLKKRLQPPSLEHLMGTDHLGRDILSRVIHGTRPMMYVVALTLSIAIPIGVFIGLVSGYLGGWVDLTVSRAIDMFMVFPPILIALAITAVLGPGLEKIVIAIGIAEIPTFARLTRSLIVVEREQLYVEAAKALGAGAFRIMFKDILPNILGPVLVQATFSTATAILWEAALSFLGLGAQPPTPSWGLMLYEAKAYFRLHPHTAVFPGLMLFITVLMINSLGETLRDYIDPRFRTIMR